jgi:hypothetical protein
LPGSNYLKNKSSYFAAEHDNKIYL